MPVARQHPSCYIRCNPLSRPAGTAGAGRVRQPEDSMETRSSLRKSTQRVTAAAAIGVAGLLAVTPVEAQTAPDLQLVSVSGIPEVIGPPGPVPITLEIHNAGDAASPATSMRVSVHHFQGSGSPSDDTLPGVVPALAPGTSISIETSLNGPTEKGLYNYYVCVNSVWDEPDTINNCLSVLMRVKTNTVDLVVTGIRIWSADNSLEVGGSFWLSATVTNSSDAAAAATTLRFFQSSDATITTSDTSVATESLPGVAPGAAGSYLRSVSLTWPDTAGTYYYGACVDAVTNESDTANNCSSSVQIDVPASLSVADGEATEGDDATLDFGVTLDRAATATVTVDYATADGTATAGVDYTSTSGTLTYAAGETTKTVSVPITDDTTEDDGETLTLTLSNASGAHLGDAVATGTIREPEPSELSVADAEATEGDDATLDFVVTLDPAASTTVTVDYTTADGTATAGSDYTSTSGTLSFAAGDTTKTVSVPITDDTTKDDGETLTLTLSNASGADLNDSEATGTIRNTETLTASFENVPSEHDGSTPFSFNLTFTSEINIGYATLRDHAFDVDEGDVTHAERVVPGKNDQWRITVKPDGNNDLTVTLPGQRACSTTGAICSKETNPVQLSNSPSATIAATSTPTVSIAGGTGAEGEDTSINFTVTLDEAASETVTVDYATSDGSAEAGDDYTATSGTLSFSAGETSKTISVDISDDSENESDETFTVTLSNASGADLGTSSATGTIRNRQVTPLTASFTNVPEEHNGAGSVFTFRLEFSEDFKLSYTVLRDDAFEVTGGKVDKAKRVDRRNDLREIHIKPDGDGTVSIRLPATTDCDATGAICTADGKKLSNSQSATVAGPVGISVADAEVEEGAGAVLAFAVSLSRAASSSLTIDYATSDGSATAGSDYTAASGTVTINAGESSGTIEVSVLDDSHDDAGETLTLTLSNPSKGTITDATATGTITNHDALPAALVARFGRTAALHVVEQVEERVNAPRAPGFDGRVAGRQINRDMGRDFALDFLQQLGGGYGPLERGPGSAMTAAGGHDPGLGKSGMTSSLGPQNTIGAPMGQGGMQGPHPAQAYEHAMGMGLGGDRLVGGSSFALNRATSNGGVLSFWSRSASSAFYGQDGALALNGDVRSTMFGADYAKGRMVTGVSLSHSRGLGGYSGIDSGQMTSAVTGLYPWIGYKASDRVTVWTVAGYGAGGLMLNPGAGAPIETGLSMAMAAGGGRGEILGDGEGFALAIKADTLWVGTRTQAASGAGGKLKATRAAVNRVRTAIEGSQKMTLAGRMALSPSAEIGIRHDGGDAETGRGMDLGAGLVLADGVTGLAVDIRVRRLLVHEAEGFAEHGMAISVSYNPTPSTPLGFSARVSPAWGGDAMSGAEALWGRESMGGVGQDHLLGGGGNRLDTEVGYGLPIGARFVGTPRVGLRTSEYGRDYRVGYGMQVLEQGRLNLELGIDAERRESPVFQQLQHERAGADQRVIGHASLSW